MNKNMYNLPNFNFNNFKKRFNKTVKNEAFRRKSSLFIILIIVLIYAGWQINYYFPSPIQEFLQYLKIPEKIEPELEEGPYLYASKFEYEQAIIDTAKRVSPSVVSIVISKNVPIYEEQYINPFGELFPDIQIPQYIQKGSEVQEIGAGSGFIVSADGLVLTNKHVVLDDKAEYTVMTNDGKKYSAKVLALDPVQDLAVIKIQSDEVFPTVVLGDSDGIQVGQGAIAIGNALGQFSNTVSVGVISGLQRTISASSKTGSFSETLEGIIQTDAAINEGNSGGPLLNLNGEVIGVNVAMADGAQAIGFALPINLAKRDIDQVTKINKIIYPFLGVKYVLVDDEVKKEYKLSVDYGALILNGSDGKSAVISDSAADKAGVKVKDIILQVNGENVSQDNSLSKILQKYAPGDSITLHILRGSQEIDLIAVLGERSS